MGRPLVARDEEATTIPPTFARRSATALTLSLYTTLFDGEIVSEEDRAAQICLWKQATKFELVVIQGGEGSGLCHLSQLLARRRRGDRIGA